MVLVSSNYSGYSTNAGWASYSGWSPAIWQYSDAVSLHSASVDFNVFLGSGTTDTATLVDEFKSVVTTGKLPDQSTWHEVAATGDKSLAQIATANSMTYRPCSGRLPAITGSTTRSQRTIWTVSLTGRSPLLRSCQPGPRCGY